MRIHVRRKIFNVYYCLYCPAVHKKPNHHNDNHMKAMSKQQLAERAGVSVRTLNSWCQIYWDDLWILGLRPRMKVLPPNIVAFLAEKFCIDLDT